MLARRLAMEEMSAVGLGHVPVHQQGFFARAAGGGGTTTRRVPCPSCLTENEFSISAHAQPSITVRCGQCSSQFPVSLPSATVAPSPHSNRLGHVADRFPLASHGSLRLCRSCGTMNQFPTPPPGQPAPNVLCGMCGSLSRGTGSITPNRRVEQVLRETHSNDARLTSGPMVRINIGGQRRVVPLVLLLALMAEEAERGNPAQGSDIAALPTQKLSSLDHLGEQTKCLICLENFADGDDLKTLPCLHIYHQRCIERWLTNDNSCPVCKTAIGQGLEGM